MGVISRVWIGVVMVALLVLVVFAVGCESLGEFNEKVQEATAELYQYAEDTQAVLADPVAAEDVEPEIADETSADEILETSQAAKDVSAVLPSPVSELVHWIGEIGLLVGGVLYRRERRKRREAESDGNAKSQAVVEIVKGVGQALKHVETEDQAKQFETVIIDSTTKPTQDLIDAARHA